MKAKCKKLLSVFLSIVMLFSITAGIDLSAYAEKSGDFEYYVLEDGTAEITDYYGFANDLTIPSEIDGYIVTSIGEYAFKSCTSLTRVTIPNSVKSIGYGAFKSCTNLTSVTIGNSVTSIGDYAFYWCTSLTSVIIPYSVTSIGYRAFYECTSLTSVTIPDSVTSIGEYAFLYVNNVIYYGTATGSPWGAKAVNGYVDGYLVYKDSTKKELLGCFVQADSVTIPNSVTRIGDEAFYNCTSLTSVTIPNSVTSISNYAFEDCTSLTSVTIPNSVTSMGYCAFYDCTSLTSITVDSGNANYSSKDGVLFNKTKTVLIQYPIGNSRPTYDIPNSVTSIGNWAFSYCKSLTSVTIPDSVTSIGNWAFSDCTSLTSVTIPDSVTSIGNWAFSDCTSLTSVTIPNSVKRIGDHAFDYCTSLTSVIIGNSVTSICDCAFEDCTSLTSVTIPNSVTRIGYGAFESCTNLTSVTIGNCVKRIGEYAFGSCKSLTSLTIPDSVTSIGDGAFKNCTSLTSVTIPDSVTSVGDNAFKNCTSLTSVTIPDSVTSIGEEAFYKCTSLTSVTIGNSVTSIGDWAFSECTSLTSATIPNSVTSIGSDAFDFVNNIVYNGTATGSPWGAKSVNGYVEGYLVYKDSTKKQLLGCSAQAISINIPDSVTSIGRSAFYKCSSLTSVTIGNSVTSIGNSSFLYCSSLSSVTIPDSVTSIGSDAFFKCTSLTSITIPNSVRSIGDWAFCLVNNIVYNGTASGSPWGAKAVNGYVDGYLVYSDSTKQKLLGCFAQAISVTIPDSVTSIGVFAFRNCTSLTSITVDSGNADYSSKDGVLFNKTKTVLIQYPIGNSRSTYDIPNSVTSIGEDAFRECSSLTSVTIPNSVTRIGEYAFDECTSLTDVYYSGSQEQWNNISIDSYNDCLLNANIHYNYIPPCDVHTPANPVEENRIEPQCEINGSYDSVVYCSVCNHVINRTKKTIAKTDHTYKTTTTKATTSKNGSVVTKCTVCGAVKSKSTIYYPKTVTLSATSYIYDGKVKTPSVTIKNVNDKTLVEGTDYTVSYASGRKNVGKYSVKITFKGKYSGTKTLYFTVKPRTTSISSLKAGSKRFTVKWYKRTTQTTGYQVQYSTSSKFSSPKTVTIGKTGTTYKTVKKLRARKRYYVRVRTYKTVNGTRYYSSWSKAKYVTTKS